MYTTIESKIVWVVMELTGEVDKVTIVAVEFSTLMTVTDSQDRQKINKTRNSSSSTINSFDETGIYIFLFFF